MTDYEVQALEVARGTLFVYQLGAGIAVGALAVQGLHAQAKPPVYNIVEIDVTNPEAYAKDYTLRGRLSPHRSCA